ncbi:putative short chain dehydrogenase [Gulosibacter sp. 10]|nr:putative short chain dehydrogenase [Gulosibacter sp. 10]
MRKLESLEQRLAAEGITAKGYVADIGDRSALAAALRSAAEDLGRIEVLQFSPVPSAPFLKPVLDTAVEDLEAAVELSILGSATAIRAVLPGMREAGRGTIILPNGSSAAVPNGDVAGTSVAFAGESAYGAMLHDALAPEGVHVAQLIIPGAIDGGDPLFASAALAERLWLLHARPGAFRITVGADEA